MKTLIKIGLGIGVVILLFICYPFYAEYVSAYYDLNIAIFDNGGSTMNTLEILFFNALPFIGLILIFWLGYKIVTSGWMK